MKKNTQNIAGLKNREFLFSQAAQSPELTPFPHINMFGTVVHKKVKLKHLKKHYNDGIEICYSWDGRFVWDIEGKEVCLHPGDVSVTCPWQEHRGKDDAISIGTLTWIIITPRVFTKNSRLTLGAWSCLEAGTEKEMGALLAPNQRPVLPECPEAGELFKELLAELTGTAMGRNGRVNYLLVELLLKIARRLAAPQRQPDRKPDGIEAVKARIEGDLAHPWTVEELAAIAGWKTTAFTRGFKKVTGSAPLHYVIEQRVEKARELLANTNLSITDLAFKLGFSSSQHFANTFKKHTGHAPRQLRKQNRN